MKLLVMITMLITSYVFGISEKTKMSEELYKMNREQTRDISKNNYSFHRAKREYVKLVANKFSLKEAFEKKTDMCTNNEDTSGCMDAKLEFDREKEKYQDRFNNAMNAYANLIKETISKNERSLKKFKNSAVYTKILNKYLRSADPVVKKEARASLERLSDYNKYLDNALGSLYKKANLLMKHHFEEILGEGFKIPEYLELEKFESYEYEPQKSATIFDNVKSD